LRVGNILRQWSRDRPVGVPGGCGVLSWKSNRMEMDRPPSAVWGQLHRAAGKKREIFFSAWSSRRTNRKTIFPDNILFRFVEARNFQFAGRVVPEQIKELNG